MASHGTGGSWDPGVGAIRVSQPSGLGLVSVAMSAPPTDSRESLDGEKKVVSGGTEKQKGAVSGGGLEPLTPDGAATPYSPLAATEPPEPDYSTLRKVFAIITLLYVHALIYIDRISLTYMKHFIKEEFELTDGEVGWLKACFVCSYMVVAFPIGYLGDRLPRKWIIFTGMSFWAIVIFLCSFTPYASKKPGEKHEWAWVIFLCRALSGVGEAAGITLMTSMISDIFVGKLRSYMLSIYFIASMVGMFRAIAQVITTPIIHAFDDDWRAMYRATPLMGIVALLLIALALKEPPRGLSQDLVNVHTTTIMEDLKYFFNTPTFVWSVIGWTTSWFTSAVLSYYVADFIVYGMDKYQEPVVEPEYLNAKVWLTYAYTHTGKVLGTVFVIAGILGIGTGSAISTYWRKTNPRANPMVCMIAKMLLVPSLVFNQTMFVWSMEMYWVGAFITSFLIMFTFAVTSDILMCILPPNRRALGKGITLFVCHLCGDAFSTVLLGYVFDAMCDKEPYKCSQVVREGRAEKFEILRTVFWIPNLVPLLGAFAYFMAMYHIIRDQRRADYAARASAQAVRKHKEKEGKKNL